MIAWNPAQSIRRTRRRRADLRTGVGVLAVTVALLLSAGVARAQGAGTAQPKGSRWWAGGGGGYLAGRSDCTNCEHDQPYSNLSAVLLQGGLRTSERMLVGGELFSSGRTIDEAKYRSTYVLAFAQYRPFAGHGLFIKGGWGMVIIKETLTVEGANTTARTRGMGLTYGAGWVLGQGRRVSVAPVAAHYVSTVGDVQTSAGAAQNVVVNGWFVGAVLMVR
jgi:hypothetical protein